MTDDELKAEWDSKTPKIGNIQEVFFNEPNTVQAAVNLAATMKYKMDNLFNGGTMNEDLKALLAEIKSEDYHTETTEIGIYKATFREIPNGEYETLQKAFFGDVHLSTKKDNLERQMNEKRVNFMEFGQKKNLLALESWSRNGVPMPIDIAVWRALPMRVTAHFEAVIERLNPEDAEAFPDGHGNGSED